MAETYTFPCGCTFSILGYDEDNIPRIDFIPDIDHVNLECSRTWDLLSSGNTKGVFQLESRLGQSFARKLKPRNIEHLAGLISVMRPSCLEAIRDKKSVTMHYIDRKNGEEEVTYFHPSLEPALKSTYAEMIYQEQAMRIAKDIAGFNMQEADALRRSIGKKKPEEMAKVKIKFLDGCKTTKIVNDDDAQQIWDWIEKSQRYGFNRSILPIEKVILDNNKKISILETNINDKIKCPTYHTNQQYTTIVNKYNHGIQPVYKVELDNGKTITCTLAHQFLCSDGKVYSLIEILKNNYAICCEV